jgi:hypothetical protein
MAAANFTRQCEPAEPIPPSDTHRLPASLLFSDACSLLNSLASLFHTSHPLFSIACSLFSQNTRGGGTPQGVDAPDLQTCGRSDLQTRFCSALCFHNLTNPFSRLPAATVLYFHKLTNPLAGKSPVFTSIQNPRGVTRPASQISNVQTFRHSDFQTMQLAIIHNPTSRTGAS